MGNHLVVESTGDRRQKRDKSVDAIEFPTVLRETAFDKDTSYCWSIVLTEGYLPREAKFSLANSKQRTDFSEPLKTPAYHPKSNTALDQADLGPPNVEAFTTRLPLPSECHIGD